VGEYWMQESEEYRLEVEEDGKEFTGTRVQLTQPNGQALFFECREHLLESTLGLRYEEDTFDRSATVGSTGIRSTYDDEYEIGKDGEELKDDQLKVYAILATIVQHAAFEHDVFKEARGEAMRRLYEMGLLESASRKEYEWYEYERRLEDDKVKARQEKDSALHSVSTLVERSSLDVFGPELDKPDEVTSETLAEEYDHQISDKQQDSFISRFFGRLFR